MRTITVMALVALGACSATSEEENKFEPVAPASIEAGLWEVDHEIASLQATDKGAKIQVQAKVGDKSTVSACVDEASLQKPAAILFAGKRYECEYRDSYIKNGRLMASLACERPGTMGEVMMSVDGSYTDTIMTGTVSTTSYLAGDGNFRMDTKIEGKRTGDCAGPAAPKA